MEHPTAHTVRREWNQGWGTARNNHSKVWFSLSEKAVTGIFHPSPSDLGIRRLEWVRPGTLPCFDRSMGGRETPDSQEGCKRMVSTASGGRGLSRFQWNGRFRGNGRRHSVGVASGVQPSL